GRSGRVGRVACRHRFGGRHVLGRRTARCATRGSAHASILRTLPAAAHANSDNKEGQLRHTRAWPTWPTCPIASEPCFYWKEVKPSNHLPCLPSRRDQSPGGV